VADTTYLGDEHGGIELADSTGGRTRLVDWNGGILALSATLALAGTDQINLIWRMSRSNSNEKESTRRNLHLSVQFIFLFNL
jgi:hypothetical protein